MRLGKQRLETLQILRTLNGDSLSWTSHPAVLMWEGYEGALALYGLEICREWKRRGYKENVYSKIKPYFDTFWHDDCMPPWLDQPLLHSRYRSALLLKGGVDAVCACIPQRNKNAWLKANGFPQKHQFTSPRELAELRKAVGVDSIGQNWYRQWDWGEFAKVDYVWPRYDVVAQGHWVGKNLVPSNRQATY